MENELLIKKEPTSFVDRVGHWITVFIVILIVFNLLLIFKNPIDDFSIKVHLIKLSIIFILFGFMIGIKIRRNKHYLYFFESDSKIVTLGFMRRNNPTKLTTKINDINLWLKNTTTRSGFDCEIRLNIDGKVLFVNNDFDWTYSEMTTMFNFIKTHKKEKISQKEDFTLSRMAKNT